MGRERGEGGGEIEEGEHGPGGVLPGAEGEPGHLGRDADAAFVQDADRVFIPLAFLAEQLVAGDVDVDEADSAGTTRLDPQLLLLFRDREPLRALFDHKRADPLVPLARVQVREYDEEASFQRVRDPHLFAVDPVAVGGLLGFGFEREGVRAGDGFGEAEGPQRVGCEPWEPFSLRFVGPVFQYRGVHECVVHVDHDAHTWIDPRQLFYPYYSRREVHAGAAVLFGDFYSHETLLE